MEPNNRNRNIIILLVVVVAIMAVGYMMSRGEDKDEIAYKTKTIERKDAKAFVAAVGKIESTTTVTVGSQVSGPISEILVDFNSVVKAGDVLARIDPSEFVARRASEQARLQSAQAGLANAQANLAGQTAAVQQSEVDVRASELSYQHATEQIDASLAALENTKTSIESQKATRANALLNYQRTEDLVARELVALSERDQARTDFLVASANLETAQTSIAQAEAQLAQARTQARRAQNDIEAARARLSVTRAQRDAAAAQVGSAVATVEQAEAALDQSAVDLRRTTIVSPIDGIVIDRKVSEGQTVAAQFQAPELFTIARDLSKMRVKAEVSEADIGRVKEGVSVKFTVDAYPDREFFGEAVQVRSAPDESSTGSGSSNVVVYSVLVTADNPEHLLKPGMTAIVEILADHMEDAILVPSQALRYVPSQGGDQRKDGEADPTPTPEATPAAEKSSEKGTNRGTLWVLEDGKPVRCDVSTGISINDDVVIVSGDIREGDELIVSESGGETKRRRFRLSL